MEKLNDAEISCKYSHAGSRTVIATAVLSKENWGENSPAAIWEIVPSETKWLCHA
jgi:hypothetical protein